MLLDPAEPERLERGRRIARAFDLDRQEDSITKGHQVGQA